MLSANHAECRKLALYAECHYAECRGAQYLRGHFPRFTLKKRDFKKTPKLDFILRHLKDKNPHQSLNISYIFKILLKFKL